MSDTNENLDRLNFYNGRRLDADDLRLEQEYHMEVRRRLNKALYTWGIADGLAVVQKSLNEVIVQQGVAIDFEGREIILLSDETIPTPAAPPKGDGTAYRSYLTIRYGEERVGRADDLKPAATTAGGNGPAFNIPAYIRATPKIDWYDQPPRPESGLVVLAEIELDDKCHIVRINSLLRKYVLRVSGVRSFAISGEADIDKDNPKELYFHIINGYPNSVKMYLRSSNFSTLYYSETGNHSHKFNTSLSLRDIMHSHDITGSINTSFHSHAIHIPKQDARRLDVKDVVTIETQDDDRAWHLGLLGKDIQYTGTNGRPPSTLTDETIKTNAGYKPVNMEKGHLHGHSITVENGPKEDELAKNAALSGTTEKSGALNIPVRHDVNANGDLIYFSGYSFFTNLQVGVSRTKENLEVPITLDILEQLRSRDGQDSWKQLGDGTTNTLVTDGTGEIDLLALGLDFPPGEYCLTFRPESGGGKLHYSLYIE